MRSIEEREIALNMYLRDGMSYQQIAKIMNVPLYTVKSWCIRYCKKMGIPQRYKFEGRVETVRKEYIHNRIPKSKSQEDRIARLEMEVDLLRNFLILTERG